MAIANDADTSLPTPSQLEKTNGPSDNAENEPNPQTSLRRDLKARHIP